MKKPILSIITLLGLGFLGCFWGQKDDKSGTLATVLTAVPNDFNAYWLAGEAELNHYHYRINRYGAWREGYQILLFVTEDFSKSQQVKLDAPPAVATDRVAILKLNTLQRFQTGIYDYSAMQSLFTPLDFRNYGHSLKTTTSVQDWCGQTFSQLNLKDSFYTIQSFSYFDTEGDVKVTTQMPALLEDELLTRLRLDPLGVPTGPVTLIPNTVFTALRHQPLVPQAAEIEMGTLANGIGQCRVRYSNSRRRLSIEFEATFPHRLTRIQTFDGDDLQTEATLSKSIKSAYWAKNAPQHDGLRAELGLKPL